MLNALGSAAARDVLNMVLDKARQGDLTAAGIVLARIWPPRKPTVAFDLPKLESPADLIAAHAAIAEAVSVALLAPEEGAAIAHVLEGWRRSVELQDIERRLANLEASIRKVT